MQRTRRSSHGISDYSVDDDHEMEAMAKVWAHPEDLHLFPVSEHTVMGCHSLVASRDVSNMLQSCTHAA